MAMQYSWATSVNGHHDTDADQCPTSHLSDSAPWGWSGHCPPLRRPGHCQGGGGPGPLLWHLLSISVVHVDTQRVSESFFDLLELKENKTKYFRLHLVWLLMSTFFLLKLLSSCRIQKIQEWPVPHCGQPPDCRHRDGRSVSWLRILVDKVKHKVRSKGWSRGLKSSWQLEMSFRENCTDIGRSSLFPLPCHHICQPEEIFILNQYHTQFLADTSNTAVNENIRFLFEIS